MKSYHFIALFFLYIGVSSGLSAQQYRLPSEEVSSSWKEQLEKLTTPYQVPLGGTKVSKGVSTTPPAAASQKTLSHDELFELLAKEYETSQSRQAGIEARKRALEALKTTAVNTKKSSGLTTSKSTSRITSSATASSKIVSDEKVEKDFSDVNDDFLQTIKTNAQNHVRKQQQQRLASGYYSQSSDYAMGEFTSLKKTRPEMYQQRKTDANKREASLTSQEPYRPDAETYLKDLKKQQLERQIPSSIQNAKLSNKRTYSLSGQRSYTVKSDSLALVDFYNNMNGASWYIQDNWLSGPVETWYGVSTTWYEVFNDTTQEFDAIYRVIGLYLGDNNLTGSLPASIGSLDSLEWLGLYGNYITGAIPAEIGNCSKLRELTLGGNFIDFIPDEIGLLTNLEYLSLWTGNYDQYGNFVTDGITTLPTSFWNLTKLLSLDLGGHSISTVDGIGNFSLLRDLWLWGNSLQSIPAEIGQLDSLRTGVFSEMALGSLPVELFNLSKLEELNVVNSQISSIPAEIGNLTNLKRLFISYNPITSLPAEIGNLSNLEEFNLGYCQLTSLPDEIGNLNVWQMELFANNLQSLPATFNNLDQLKEVRLWGNNISAPISTLFGLDSAWVLDLWANAENGGGFYGTLDGISANANLTQLFLGYNKLSGVIPAEMGLLSNLNVISAEINQFTGVDKALFELPNISWINLHTNQIAGSFPVTTGTESLISINLNNNNLEGLSTGIGNFPNLRYLYITANQLSGQLPAEMANDTSLIEVNFHNNHLTGTIPDTWTYFPNLISLEISYNQLDQPLPDVFAGWPQINGLYLNDNQIPGVLPPSFGQLFGLREVYLSNNQLTGLTDMAEMGNLGDFRANMNRLEYGDLEQLINLPSLYYVDIVPQQDASVSTAYISLGQSFSVNAKVSGTANHYTWYHNGVQLVNIPDTTSILTVQDATIANAGTYWSEITNDIVTNSYGLYLSSGDRNFLISVPVLESDSLALVDFYQNTNGDSWNYAYNWLKTPVVMWEGVVIENNRVVKLELSGQNIQGSIPPSFASLDALEWLSLYNNGITNISGEFYGLSNLHYLDLDNNQIDKISPSLSLLSKLDTLWIGGNPISGPMPAVIFELTNLRVLGFYNTDIYGDFPTEFSSLPNLEGLWFSNNPNIHGSIPSSLSTLSKLKLLQVSFTDITGGLENISPLTNLEYLYLYDVPATKDGLPDGFTALSKMRYFGLGFQDLSTFGVPTEIFSWPNLEGLQIVDANITADIPDGFSNFSKLRLLNLRDNHFGSSITPGFPESMGVDSMRTVNIRNNNFEDISIFAGADSLKLFYAQGNRLQFDQILPFVSLIEKDIVDFSFMQPVGGFGAYEYVEISPGDTYSFNFPLSLASSLDLDISVFWAKDGELVSEGVDYEIFEAINPETDGQYEGYAEHAILTQLTGLTLYTGVTEISVVEPVNTTDSTVLLALYDYFGGEPVDIFGNWKQGSVENWSGVYAVNGQVLALDLSGLTGTLPGTILGSFQNLQYLYLYNGNLTGQIPTEIFTQNLIYLDLSNNRLTGNVPVEISNSINLEGLNLSYNRLSGDLPSEIGASTNLTNIFLNNNRLTGTVPAELFDVPISSLLLDKNLFNDLPVISDTISLKPYSYLNLEYNNFNFDDLANFSGNNVENDFTYAPQGNTRAIYFTGYALIDSTITLHAERQHELDEFYWFKADKNNNSPTFYQIGYTGFDSLFSLPIDNESYQAKYMAVVVNQNYKNGNYPFLTKQVVVDPFPKRYATGLIASPFDDPAESFGTNPNSIIGQPDMPQMFYGEGFYYGDLQLWYYDKWYHNALEPRQDVFTVAFEDNPIPVNYIRLHSPWSELNIKTMTLKGTGGESVTLTLNREIYNYQNQVVFPKTKFAVNAVELEVTNGSIDALEIGDTGIDNIEAPQLDANYTYIGEDYIYFEVQYNGLADYIIIERSNDGEVFAAVDSITYFGWYYDEVPAGKYYYRAKARFKDLDLSSEYSNTLEIGNCLPTIPANKIWAGISVGFGDSQNAGRISNRDTVEIFSTGSYAQFWISDFSAGWFDGIYGYEYNHSANFTQQCDVIRGYSETWLETTFSYANDTLYVDWIEYGESGINFHVLSKFYVIGDQEVTPENIYPAYNIIGHLISSSKITLTWEDPNQQAVDFVIQEAVTDNTKFQDIATISNVNSYDIVNTLDGKYHFYRVVTKSGEVITNPSDETFMIHQQPMFDPVVNALTTEQGRESYAGSWADFDGDGDDDLYVTNAGDFANNFLFENTGGGSFNKIIGTLATQRAAQTYTSAWGDYDNDGFVDLFVPSEDKGGIVYKNTGSKSFERTNLGVTTRTLNHPSISATWLDMNNDGYLDLITSVGIYFINDGLGNLSNESVLQVSQVAMTDLNSDFYTVSHVDIDNDGDQDLYFTGDYNLLFVNNGSGSFTAANTAISNGQVSSTGYTWADFNNDGYIDLITGDSDYRYLGIYANNGNMNFDFYPIASENGTTNDEYQTDFSAGYTVADFDNDGFVDVIWVIDGRARLVLNQGNFDFYPVPQEEQSFPAIEEFALISVADINLDGAMDIFIPTIDPTQGNIMYVNHGNDNAWISLKLKGIESNRAAIGAKVVVTAFDKTMTQTIRSQNGLGSGNSLAAEFGVGDNITNIASIEVVWPSGVVTLNENVAVNQILTITEIPQSTGPTVSPQDSSILVKLYASTGGANWIRKQGWPSGSPLGWEGTTWTNGRLTSLILNENNLIDSIPEEIGGLSALEYLDLSSNQLVGDIPAELGNLTALVNLSLNNNQIEGKIPGSIGALVNLTNLDLYNNQLFGALPTVLGNLKSLTQLELHNNDFIGFIPAEIGTLSKLEVLKLDNNHFEGLLPEGLGAMSSLAVFYVNDNDLTGPLPSDLGNLKNLIEFKAQNNLFNDMLPASFAQLTGISVIDISNNQFEGSLSSLAALDSMSYLNVSGNHFTDLPDMTGNSASKILAQNNWLDFGDFDLNNSLISNQRLLINPQDSLYERIDTLHNVGAQIKISYAIGGQLNNYSWKLDGEPFAGDNTNVFVSDAEIIILNPDSPQEGEYVLEVTNESYAGVKLVTRPFNLKLSSLERDKKALLEFLAAVDADDVFKVAPTNWSSANELTSDWQGVTVEGNRVTALNLPAVIDTDLSDGDQSKIFEGNIPASFADLTGIKTLNISGHYLKLLPNISNWPNLISADVTRNRMSFKSFLNNTKILGTKLTYAPQRRIGTTIYDTLKAGDDPVLFVDNQGVGASYQWKFGPYIAGSLYNNDVTSISGATSRVYQIENLDYNKMGTYRVEVTHTLVPGLTLTSRNMNIMAATDIYGNVYADGAGTILTDGQVLAFRKTPQGPYVREDTVSISSSGEYAFTDVVLGDFLILTKPNRDIFPNTVDTYYGKTELYDEAQILEVRSKSEGIDIQMVFYEDPTIDPKGANFEGVLFSDLTEDQQGDEEGNGRILSRKKVKRAACSMRRFVASGRADEEGTYELYAYVESDDDGNFTFTDIEEGKYLLNIQYPGVPMDPDSDIEFIVGGDKEDQLFTLTAVITDDGIQVEAKEVLYTLKPYIKDVVLYPNPTQGDLKAEFLVYRKLNDLKLEVMDVKGVKLIDHELSPRMGLQSIELDLTNYEAGVYFMVFTDDAGTFKHQVKVSKY